jgi:dihydroflavonol-4-reductase
MATNELNIFVLHQLKKMIAVTGASGMLGAHFIFELAKTETKIIALKREQSNIAWIKPMFDFLDPNQSDLLWNKIEWRDADLNNIFSLSDALNDATVIYHCAAAVDLIKKSKDDIIVNNVQGTANLVDALIDLPHHVKLLHVSSIAALGKPEAGNTVTISTEWKEDDEQSPYAFSKYYSELEAWRGFNEGLSVISVLPGVIIGIGADSAPSMAPFKRVAQGKNKITDGKVGLVSIEDVVKQSIALMNIEEAIGKRYVLVADNWTFKHWFEVIAEAMGSQIQFIVLSKKKLNTLAFWERIICLFTWKSRKLKKSTINSLTGKNEYDGNGVVETTNLPYEGIENQINKVIAWQKN